ncbi:MAG TPA: cytochrome b562 [Bdellovibrionota bacterium]|nr:cytochrome b562 [Bdellovibrionota bacterium]
MNKGKGTVGAVKALAIVVVAGMGLGAALPKTQLALVMGKIVLDYKGIQKNLEDPAKADQVITLARDLKEQALKARDLVPTKITGNATEFAAYQVKIDELVKETVDLEAAVQAKDVVAARAVVDRMTTTRNEGHERFK